MININDFVRFFDFLANKSQRGNNITPELKNAVIKRAYYEWITSVYGNHREYQVGQPLPRVNYESTQSVIDLLSFLKVEQEFRVSEGKISIPDGQTIKNLQGQLSPEYIRFSSLRCYYNTQIDNQKVKKESKDVFILRDDEIGKRMSSQIVPPTNKYPVAAFYNNYIRIEPKEIQYAVLTYLRAPKEPKWAYTINDKRQLIYDPINSVDIEAPQIAFNEIVVRALSFLGINMRDAQVMQYAEQMKQQGI